MCPVVFIKTPKKCGKSEIYGMHANPEVDQAFQNTKIRDIARASSAAYPFFAAKIINEKQYVDGGFLFNNVDILLLNLLKQDGFLPEKIKILSLGNAPSEIMTSSQILERAKTMFQGLLQSLKSLINPETYYEQYFAMCGINFEHSIAETSCILGKNYIRIAPQYPNNQFIRLDSVSVQSLQTIKYVGGNWIRDSEQKGVYECILKWFGQVKKVDLSVEIMPRYYSYRNLYSEIENIEDEGLWKKNLLNFNFPYDSKEIVIEPKNIYSLFKYFFQNMDESINDLQYLICKAAAIGHIPSLAHILEGKKEEIQKELILQPGTNNWNSLHYAAANGEIAAFVYLVEILVSTYSLIGDGQLLEIVYQCN
ncbi:patatin-like phospholipase family protein, putative [Ichthyophthirius multifiliis]|uniref:Patatin-like phospholipase family protein, putative n=1 Tax=Ichthyophthirius multifiliis TaxID=5932 RepID=G0R1G6_ICHMU|nr:patatin-like phospholipase family protein, putative [Ichthyophthirius multifiliis]EGR28689.1 patatin-like phospholipase family protein, putative [Ichthyophthirius multifiliis]|eukprot:XP_004029925.1 patatin-like phospholipase family protein, putative [Ichthyophthirius multifiliis]